MHMLCDLITLLGLLWGTTNPHIQFHVGMMHYPAEAFSQLLTLSGVTQGRATPLNFGLFFPFAL